MRVAGIIHNDIINGPGLRCTIFVQGCDHHCKGCHSPHTWSFTGGREMTKQELIQDVTSNELDHSITWSGGDPLYQVDELTDLVKYFHGRSYHQMLFTGFTKEEIDQLCKEDPKYKELLRNLNILITDRYDPNLRSLESRFRGSSNQRVWVPRYDAATDTVTLENVTGRWDAEDEDL